MSNQKHTPEPWMVSGIRRKLGDEPVLSILGADDMAHTLVLYGNGSTKQHRASHADAERIVACVNAMQGIDDPASFVRKVRQVFSESGELNFEVLSRIAEDLKGGE